MPFKADLLDADGYPSESLLRYLRRISRNPKRIEEMFRLIIECWAYKYAGYYRRRGRKVFLSTAGWSGNESLIAAVEGTFNWHITAFSWRRGGHYIFELPKWIDVSGLAKTYVGKGGE